VKNTLSVSGKLKNIRKFDGYDNGVMVVAQLTQRNDEGKSTFTIPIATYSKEVVKVLEKLAELTDDNGYTPEVVISGELNTKFDTRKGVDNADRKAPLTRIVIADVELV